MSSIRDEVDDVLVPGTPVVDKLGIEAVFVKWFDGNRQHAYVDCGLGPVKVQAHDWRIAEPDAQPHDAPQGRAQTGVES